MTRRTTLTAGPVLQEGLPKTEYIFLFFRKPLSKKHHLTDQLDPPDRIRITDPADPGAGHVRAAGRSARWITARPDEP